VAGKEADAGWPGASDSVVAPMRKGDMSKFRKRARRGAILVAALGALVAIVLTGIATAGGGSEKACVGNLCFEGGGKFTPKKLSKTKQTPIALEITGKIQSTDPAEPHPPALREVIVETDKNGAINLKGYPTCKKSKLQSVDTKHAEAACKSAIIGSGIAKADVKLIEQDPVLVTSKLLVFNGGVSGATTTLYIHVYFSKPVPGAIVTTVKITKIHNGRYGLKSVATIPKIASGAGSATSFQLKIKKEFTYKGKKVSVLTAKCPDGRLQAHALAKFENGLKAETEFIRPCTGT
jgi:hypothetical protein